MKRVLILCTGNSCRSQMAEAFWRHLGEGAWEAFSAGSKPTGQVHPMAVTAMQEIGLDISTAESESLEGYVREPYDLVVTVCDNARESCPAFPGALRVVHWPFPDPADAQGTEAERLASFRAVRDAIEARIREFLERGE